MSAIVAVRASLSTLFLSMVSTLFVRMVHFASCQALLPTKSLRFPVLLVADGTRNFDRGGRRGGEEVVRRRGGSAGEDHLRQREWSHPAHRDY
mgnify:CR=1 FL=1